MSSMFKVAVVLLSLSALEAVDFVCPTARISVSDGTSGVIPSGATDVVHVPAGINCTILFDIPKGFALKMETTATYETSPGDYVWFDSFYVPSSADKEVEYTVKREVPLKIVSVTGNFTFLGRYSYVDMTSFTQVVQPTGTYFNATLEPKKYYTFQASTPTEQVVFNVAMRETGFYDHTVYQIFVFDGNDIVNAEYVGRVSDFMKYFDASTSNTMTFLNLYQEASNSFIVGNDWSKVKPMDEYNTIVVDGTKDTDGYMENMFGRPDSYWTFICDGCTNFNLEALTFDTTQNFNDASGYVEVQGMTPTHGLQPLLRYEFSTLTNMSLPLFVPAPMATLHVYRAAIKYLIRPKAQNEWLDTYLDHKRCVFSPKLWNADADQQFDYSFGNLKQMFNYSISLDSVKLVDEGDKLQLQIEDQNGITLDQTYTKTSQIPSSVSAIGKGLHMVYKGAVTSEVRLRFVTRDPVNPSTDGTPFPRQQTTSGATGTTGSSQKSEITSTTPTASSSTSSSSAQSTNSRVSTSPSSASSSNPATIVSSTVTPASKDTSTSTPLASTSTRTSTYFSYSTEAPTTSIPTSARPVLSTTLEVLTTTFSSPSPTTTIVQTTTTSESTTSLTSTTTANPTSTPVQTSPTSTPSPTTRFPTSTSTTAPITSKPTSSTSTMSSTTNVYTSTSSPTTKFVSSTSTKATTKSVPISTSTVALTTTTMKPTSTESTSVPSFTTSSTPYAPSSTSTRLPTTSTTTLAPLTTSMQTSSKQIESTTTVRISTAVSTTTTSTHSPTTSTRSASPASTSYHSTPSSAPFPSTTFPAPTSPSTSFTSPSSPAPLIPTVPSSTASPSSTAVRSTIARISASSSLSSDLDPVTTPSSLGMTSTLGTTTSDATSSTFSTCLLIFFCIKCFF